MGVIAKFARQTATFESYLGRDSTGRPTYTPLQTIRVRKTPDSGIQRTFTGAEVEAETSYLTEVALKPKDRLDGANIHRVKEIVNVRGETIGYEARV